MDAMGLTFKKPHTVSASLSGSFNHDPAESPKFPGIVSTVPLVLVLTEAGLTPSVLIEVMPPFLPHLPAALTSHREGLHTQSSGAFMPGS